MMKLCTVDDQEWQQVAPFVDTLILPVASCLMEQKQVPFQSLHRLERVAERVEQGLQGRVFLLPTIVDYGMAAELFRAVIHNTVQSLQKSGFAHLVVLTDEKHTHLGDDESLDSPVFSMITKVVSCEPTDDMWELEKHVREATESIVQNWQNSY
ncbi:DUF2487 family protein [Thermoactinomyces sp. DSM 45892]|uniref:DUF2487 family protein n=1 Tax=Thermoactinomyces sp. DSM 45892 TaxID=1882753 RepID=UPI0008980CDD|nr:DUF2487 family protein [Thermoactinomyces sp. DSM 45892]SDY97964.1 Protein of unknown function [Thermoactinomyces sp. DSM 45892]